MAKQSGGRKDPYSWAGKLGIETGPVPIRRWTPHRVVTAPTSGRNDALQETSVAKRWAKGEMVPFVTK